MSVEPIRAEPHTPELWTFLTTLTLPWGSSAPTDSSQPPTSRVEQLTPDRSFLLTYGPRGLMEAATVLATTDDFTDLLGASEVFDPDALIDQQFNEIAEHFRRLCHEAIDSLGQPTVAWGPEEEPLVEEVFAPGFARWERSDKIITMTIQAEDRESPVYVLLALTPP